VVTFCPCWHIKSSNPCLTFNSFYDTFFVLGNKYCNYCSLSSCYHFKRNCFFLFCIIYSVKCILLYRFSLIVCCFLSLQKWNDFKCWKRKFVLKHLKDKVLTLKKHNQLIIQLMVRFSMLARIGRSDQQHSLHTSSPNGRTRRTPHLPPPLFIHWTMIERSTAHYWRNQPTGSERRMSYFVVIVTYGHIPFLPPTHQMMSAVVGLPDPVLCHSKDYRSWLLYLRYISECLQYVYKMPLVWKLEKFWHVERKEDSYWAKTCPFKV